MRLPPRYRGVLAFVAVLLTLLLAGWFLPERLAYDREVALAGEWWRPFSSSFTHLTRAHLLHNLLVVGIMVGAFCVDWPHPTARGLAYAQVGSAIAFAGILVLAPNIEWYRGLSGVLHGSWLLMAAGYALARETRLFGVFATIMLLLKVATEWHLDAPLAVLWGMAPPYPVLIETHALGVLAAAFALPWLWLDRPQT